MSKVKVTRILELARARQQQSTETMQAPVVAKADVTLAPPVSAPQQPIIASPQIGRTAIITAPCASVSRDFGPRSFAGRRRLTIVSKADSRLFGEPTYKSKWIPAATGGFKAAVLIHGRPVFHRLGPRPTDYQREYGFELIGENNAQSAYHAQTVVPEIVGWPIKFATAKSGTARGTRGTMVCTNRRPGVVPFHSSKPFEKPHAEWRHASASDTFARDDDLWDIIKDYDYELGCDDTGAEELVNDQVDEIWELLPWRAKFCHACGFEDCRCDGTARDWVPARYTSDNIYK